MNDRLFLAKIVERFGCEVWTGRCNEDGYGEVFRQGKLWKAHRWAWTLRHGPIPDGMNVLHTCDNPPCCKDEHHFLGTQQDNIADMARKGRHGKSTLSNEEVAEIRERASGGEIQQRLAEEFGVQPPCISRIVRGLRRAQ